jgi:hypothetical protein
LANLAWGFSNLGYRDDQLFGAIADQLLGTVASLNPQMLINVIWAYGHVGFRHEELFAEFCDVLKREKETLSGKLYATAVWSISMAHPEMLVGLACREDLDRPGYDVAGWIQLYNALLLAGVLSTADRIPAYERMVERMIIGTPNAFEIDVERTIRDILADRPHTIEAQRVIGGVVTDWYVEVNGRKFAIECDGRRHHVLMGPDGGVDEGGQTGVAPAHDYAQDRVLRLFGVTPIHVLASTFYACHGDVPTLVSALLSDE